MSWVTAATLDSAQGLVALAALAVSVLALIACIVLARSLRRARSAQKLVLGGGSERDVVEHAASLQRAFEALQDYVGEVALRIEGRLDGVESGLAGAIVHRALIRYDAYNELSGQQSMSLALLDERSSGVVLTCIHHRDQARLYAKQVLGGHSELELSPEEDEAVRTALASSSTDGAGAAAPSAVGSGAAVDPGD